MLSIRLILGKVRPISTLSVVTKAEDSNLQLTRKLFTACQIVKWHSVLILKLDKKDLFNLNPKFITKLKSTCQLNLKYYLLTKTNMGQNNLNTHHHHNLWKNNPKTNLRP